jgi:hypothetical protein
MKKTEIPTICKFTRPPRRKNKLRFRNVGNFVEIWIRCKIGNTLRINLLKNQLVMKEDSRKPTPSPDQW